MTAVLKSYTDQTYAALRIVAGFLFLWHGSQKLLGFPAGSMEIPAFVVYVAGPIELVGGLLLVAGFMTRWAAYLCSGLMAAAYWMAHGFTHVLPLENGGELAVIFCFVFLFIAANGPGIWSVDASRGAS